MAAEKLANDHTFGRMLIFLFCSHGEHQGRRTKNGMIGFVYNDKEQFHMGWPDTMFWGKDLKFYVRACLLHIFCSYYASNQSLFFYSVFTPGSNTLFFPIWSTSSKRSFVIVCID